MGKALVIKDADFSSIAVDTIEITVGKPTIQIDIYGVVAITSPNGEDIYYTTDGSTPTNQSTKYTAGFSVQNGTTVKAVCYLGGNYSEVVSQQYDGTLQAPVINITNKGVVTITATDGASIRYTTDGQTDPTSSSGSQYAEPFKVENGVVVKAIAYLTSGSTTISSSVSTETAVVPEGITAGKRFTSEVDNTIIDDPTRFISPFIPVTPGSTVTWRYTGTEYGKDFLVMYGQDHGFLASYNIQSQGQTNGSRSCALRNTAYYVRITNLMGQSYAGAKVSYNGEDLWTYDGSTE